MPGVVDPAFWGDESGNYLLIGINRDRSFEEMFPNFSCSLREIMAAVSARKPGWIDRGYSDNIVIGVKQIQGFSEGEPEIERPYSVEKFLNRSEMGHYWKIKYLLNSLHVTNIFNELPVVLVPVILEQNENQKLMLGVDLFWIFTGIQIEMRWFYNWNGGLDKPDIPARWCFNCLLSLWCHNQEKETLYLRSFGRRYNLFWIRISTEQKF